MILKLMTAGNTDNKGYKPGHIFFPYVVNITLVLLFDPRIVLA
jgi:hypothetical protein